MKFDLLVEQYLSLYLEADERSHTFSPANQIFTPRFEKDIKRLNGNPQNKKELKDFFIGWDNGNLSPTFEMKFQSKDGILKDSLRAVGINNVNHFPIFAVEVRSRRPSIHLLCTKFADRVVWLRAFVGYDEYTSQLTHYR